jgi:alanine-glyoxylate transaminase/serine-glyoxylate transaminase/serine-pyruvate transaminase
MIVNYWEGQKRAYHHTAPINMIYALYQSLFNLLEEGLDNAFARHRKNHELLVAGLEKLGLQMFVDASCRLPMLNAVVVPDGVDEAAVRRRLREDFMIEIGAGLGPMAGKVWRIGLMGETCRPANVERILSAFREIL